MINTQHIEIVIRIFELLIQIGVFVIAVIGFNTWRKEHLGKKRIDSLEKVYPILRTIEHNLPLILRKNTTDYELSRLKQDESYSKIYEQHKDKRSVIIDFRLQNDFGNRFRELQNINHISDLYLPIDFQNYYRVISQLNLYFPIEYYGASDEIIDKCLKELQSNVSMLTSYIKNELNK